MFGPCFIIQYFVSFLFCNHFDGEERVGCFTLTVFLMYCERQYSVSLYQGTLGEGAMCDCDIS